MTPLDVALSRGRGSCAKYLQLSGAIPASKMLTDPNRGSSNDSHIGMHTSGSSPDHDSLTLSENISNFLDRGVGVGGDGNSIDPTSLTTTAASPHDHKASQVDVLRESLKDQGSQTLANGHQPMAFGPLHHGNTTAKVLYQSHHRHPDIQHSHRRDRSEPAEDASQVSGDTFNTLKDSGIGGQSDRGDYSDFESDNPSSVRGGSDPLPSSKYHDGDVTSRHHKRHRTTRMITRRGGSDGGYDRKIDPKLRFDDKETGIAGSSSKSKSSGSSGDAILDNMKR